MSYLICDKCGDYYELQKGESENDFDKCDCGGDLRETKSLKSVENDEKVKYNMWTGKPKKKRTHSMWTGKPLGKVKDNGNNIEEVIDDFMEREHTKLDKTKKELNITDRKNICKFCGTNNTENAKYCIKCGIQFGGKNFCTQCGTENPQDAQFCQECGNEIRRKLAHKTSDNTSISKSKKSEYNTEITIGWLGVLLFIPLGFIMGLILLTKDEKHARNHGIAMIVVSIFWFILFVTVILPMLRYILFPPTYYYYY